MKTQTPLKHMSSAPEPPERHAQRKKSSITPKRSGAKVMFNRTSGRKKKKLHKRFKRTSQKYCATLLDRTLSHIAETHSNSLARLASPVLSTSTPLAASPASPRSTATVKDHKVKNSIHAPAHGDMNAAAAAAAALTINAQGQITSTGPTSNTNHDETNHKARNKNTSNSSDEPSPSYSPQQNRLSNGKLLESLRTLIQPLCIRIPKEEEEEDEEKNTDQSNDTPSPFHKLNQHMTSFARAVAAKESELRTLWHDWDENTRAIRELVDEVRDDRGCGRGHSSSSSNSNKSADDDGDGDTKDHAYAHAHAPTLDGEKQPRQVPLPFEKLKVQIEKISADAIDAMHAEVRDQQARRRVVREKMLAVLKEGMIGS